MNKYHICIFLLSLLIVTSANSREANESSSTKNNSSKVIMITGASQGIGLATAAHLAEQGYIVYAGVRTIPTSAELISLAQKFPDHVAIVEQDVTNQATIDASCATILKRFGRIDALINNACEIVLGPMEMQTIEQQQRVMDVNYFGPVRTIQAVAPIMRKQEFGRIINISSVAGIEGYSSLESYAASKHALEGLSESLATTLAPWNISVSLIEIGQVRTRCISNFKPAMRMTKQTECFRKYNEVLTDFMNKRLETAPNTPGVVEPIEVAQCIENIIKTEKPHLRYQIGEYAQTIARERFKDATGDSYLEAKNKLFAERGFVIRNN